MTATRASTSVLPLAACLVVGGALMMRSVQAQEVGPSGREPVAIVHFDLPAEPLDAALNAYDRLTDVNVLIDSSMLGERMSSPVNGDYSPREALQRLLVGTGLQMRFTRADAALIEPLPEGAQVTPSATSPPAGIAVSSITGAMEGGNDFSAYVALIQTRLTEALCASPQTHPGSYRLAVQLRVDNSGAIRASRILGSTGTAARDAAIAQALRTLVLDSPPPAALPQPVTILLRPLDNSVVDVCRPLDGAG